MKTVESTITEQLRRLLLAGEFPPEHHLQEIPLAERLGGSRTPIRAALATLAQEGLLTSRPKRGYFVREIALKDVMDAHRVRGQLEALACRILCELGPDAATLAELEDCVATGERLLSDDELPGVGAATWWENNERFHRRIISASGNAALIEATNRTLALPLVSSRVARWFDADEIRVSQYHHTVIVDAIKARQASRAEAMMIEHVFVGSQRIRRSFAQGAQAPSVTTSV
jgi:GntR family transcriptional regulator of vanillate catabolism